MAASTLDAAGCIELLAACPALRCLALRSSSVDGALLQALQARPGLEELELRDCLLRLDSGELQSRLASLPCTVTFPGDVWVRVPGSDGQQHFQRKLEHSELAALLGCPPHVLPCSRRQAYWDQQSCPPGPGPAQGSGQAQAAEHVRYAPLSMLRFCDEVLRYSRQALLELAAAPLVARGAEAARAALPEDLLRQAGPGDGGECAAL